MAKSPTNRRKKGERTAPDAEVSLDEVDRRILEAILQDPRMTRTELAHRVGLSRASVTERMRDLVRSGVIASWRVELDPKALGLRYTAFVRIRTNGGQSGAVEDIVRATPAVVECYRTTGEDSLLLKMHVASIPEFEEITGRLQRYGQLVAVDVLSTVVAPRAPRLRQVTPERP